MNKIIDVVGAVILKDGNVLCARRGPDGSLPGLWEFPGGKLEVGESLEDCIKRELKEELDIDAKIGKLFTSYIYSYSHITYHLFFYEILSFEGAIKMNVHKKIIWETVDRFKYYDFLPGDIHLIKIMLN